MVNYHIKSQCKTIVLSMVFLFTLLILMNTASAGFFSFTCTDSDGQDIYSKGTASEARTIWPSKSSIIDSCSGTTLTESYCEAKRVKTKTYNCVYGCKNGACNTKAEPVAPTTTAPPATSVPTLATGCYIDLAEKSGQMNKGKTRFKISNTFADCRDFSLAFQFADRNDSIRLLVRTMKASNSFNNISAEALLLNDMTNAPRNRSYVLLYAANTKRSDGTQNITVFGDDNNSIFTNANVCTRTDYFGVKLFCFNKISGYKNNSFGKMIRMLTFLKLASTNNTQNAKGENVDVFNWIVKEGVEYYDGNAQTFMRQVNPSLDTGCSKEGGAANFRKNSTGKGGLDHDVVFICDTMYKSDKVQIAGILFHEINHRYDGGKGHQYAVYNITSKKSMCRLGLDTDREPPIIRGDQTMISVYGAHLNFLQRMSQNTFLSDAERCNAYNNADSELIKVCSATLTTTRPVGCNTTRPPN